MRATHWKIFAALAWLIISGVLLASGLASFFVEPPPIHFPDEMRAGSYWEMTLIGFPTSVLGFALSYLMETLGFWPAAPWTLWHFVTDWLLVFAFGTMQWFVLVPRLFRRIQSASSRSAAEAK